MKTLGTSPARPAKKKKRELSPEARARIVTAIKRRWQRSENARKKTAAAPAAGAQATAAVDSPRNGAKNNGKSQKSQGMPGGALTRAMAGDDGAGRFRLVAGAGEVVNLDPETVRRSPFNRTVDPKSDEFRDFLKKIKEHGVLQNGIVRSARDSKNPKIAWEVIAGEWRWLAAKMAKKPFPARVKECGDTEALELQAMENLDRHNLNPLDEGTKYQQLRDAYQSEGLNKTAALLKIQERTGSAESTIYERLALLALPEETQKVISGGRLAASHSGLLTKLKNPGTINKFAKDFATKDDGSGIGFREAKKIVEEAVERERNLADYQRQSEEYRKNGAQSRILPPHVLAKMHMNEHSEYVDEDSGYMSIDKGCHQDSKYRTYRELLGKSIPPTVSPFLAVRPNGKALTVYTVAAVRAAIGGKIKTQSQSGSSSERGKERAHRRRSKEFMEFVGRVVKRAEVDLETKEFWLLFARLLVGQWRSEPLRRVEKRRGIQKGTLAKSIHAGISFLELRAMCLEILIYAHVPSSYQSGWLEGAKDVAAFFKEPLPEWNATAESQTSGDDEAAEEEEVFHG